VVLRNIGVTLFEILFAFVWIQRPLSIGFPHKSFGKRLESSNTQCNRLPDIAAFRSSLRPFGRTKMQSLGRQPAAWLNTLNLESYDQPATDTISL
jgi:hypothetical protein